MQERKTARQSACQRTIFVPEAAQKHPYSHDKALNDIGEYGLKGIRKAVASDAYGFIVAIGKRAALRYILRNQITVVLIGRIAEGLSEKQRKTDDKIDAKIKDKKNIIRSYIYFSGIHISSPVLDSVFE